MIKQRTLGIEIEVDENSRILIGESK